MPLEEAQQSLSASFFFFENDIVKFKEKDVGKVLIDKPYAFALIQIVDPDLKEFVNTEVACGKSKVKIFKPDWIQFFFIKLQGY